MQEPSWRRELAVPAALGLIVSGVGILARSARPLLWSALLLCGEEAFALGFGRGPAQGWAVAFAVLLFVGLDLAYLASTGFEGRQPLAVHARSLLPVYAVAVGATLLLALVCRAMALSGLGPVLIGVGGAMALMIVLALAVLKTRGADRR